MDYMSWPGGWEFAAANGGEVVIRKHRSDFADSPVVAEVIIPAHAWIAIVAHVAENSMGRQWVADSVNRIHRDSKDDHRGGW